MWYKGIEYSDIKQKHSDLEAEQSRIKCEITNTYQQIHDVLDIKLSRYNLLNKAEQTDLADGHSARIGYN